MQTLKSSYKAGALGLAGILLVCIGNSPPLAGERGSQSTEQPSALSSAILTRAQLTPPLRTPLVELRFSPDGKYILAQDESTIYLLTREPLSVRFQIDAQGIPAARFSTDSQRLIVATRSMGVEWRALPDGKILGTSVLGSGKPCYDAQLSPHGDLYACIDGDVVLRLFDITKNQQIFGEKIGEIPSSYVAPKSAGGSARIPKWWTRLRNLPVLRPSIRFSTDARFVVASSFHRQSIAVDVLTRNRIKLQGPLLQALDDRAFEFIAADRVVVQQAETTSGLAILSFPAGAPMGKWPIDGHVIAASDPRYAIVSEPEAKQITAVNLQTGRTFEEFQAEAADILGDVSVRYDRAHDEIVLSQGDSPNPTAKLQLPVGSISLMSAAAASGDLSSLAIAVPANGGVFRASLGKRIAQVENLEGAWFDGKERCFSEVRQRDGNVGLDRIDLASGTVSNVSPPWLVATNQTKARLMFSGPVVISILAPSWGEGERTSERTAPGSILGLQSVAFEKTAPEHLDRISQKPSSEMKITALDLMTGNQLWSRKYNPQVFFQYDSDVPLWEDVGQPFAEPQGTRFIFAWYAYEKTARKAAKQASGAVQHQMKTSRISARDSFFEVMDRLTGMTVGGTLVQHGDGPGSFDGAFSAGDWLILVSGARRFSVFSLSSGEEVLHSFALYAVLSGEKGLLGLAEEHGRLSLYDLKSGKKSGEFVFPENVVYAHFSTDGRRLLVTTEHQSVYVLDVSK
jgi:hypothetical protein